MEMKFNLAKGIEKSGISKSELAEMVGVHRSTINRIDKGETFPSIPLISKISKALKVPESELVSFKK